MTSEPMSDARLAEIRGRIGNLAEMREVGPRDFSDLEHDQLCAIAVAYDQDVPALLADNERLRAREAALLVHQRATQEDIIEGRAREAALVAVVERVAEAGVGDDSSGGTWLMFSGYDAETVREQARALLAATEPTDATTAERE